ncbi:hypothetical protein K466DRAFT_546057 [Polyporus arcularius HHB13444]|uniref:Fungal-type protein kinase domain-containing protein n=1 Tax=Polyporus arcularius HHB13444 TaxID=1314778 RepID=A0A5C3PGV6_9APHY|nr:hypothetical protein K466DRAFT_546057 [Polyporus arcularius HHB13444]
MRPYILYRLLDVNSRLFSRATTAWLTIEDTRIPGPDGRLIDDPEQSKDFKPKPRIMKEAWRQVVRTPEEAFYKRLSDKIPENERFGLPKLVCGGDLGQLDVLEWERSNVNASIMTAEDRATRLPSHPLPAASSKGKAKASQPQGPIYPQHYPQHQTFSWAIGDVKTRTFRERSHMRLVIDDVGRPLTKAKNTKELVRALRDATIGHKLAFEKAGVLHRDMSVGNILIVDEAEDESFAGFIHDFDYSAMTDVAPGDEPELADSVGADGLESMGVVLTFKDDERKERTGTYYFMAVEILRSRVVHGVHHDLESLYWVLVWIVLRHTVHNLSVTQAQGVFVFGIDRQSAGMKVEWVSSQVDEFEIPGNEPLTKLLRDMALLVIKSIGTKTSKPEPLTHDAVIQLFDEALASPGWPEIDFVPCQWLDKSHASVPGVMHDPGAAPKAPRASKKTGDGAPRSDAEKMPPPSEIPTSYKARLRSKGPRSATVAASAAPSGPKPSSSSSSRKRKAEEPAEPVASGSGRAASSAPSGSKPSSSSSSRKRKAEEPAEPVASGSGRSRSSKRSKGSSRSENVD